MQTSPDAKNNTASKPSIFGNGTTPAPPPTFGGFGGDNLFSKPASSAPSPSPTKPLFGAKPDEKSTPAIPFTFGAKPAEQSGVASPSIFGATTQTSSATTTPTTAPSLFGASTSQNPFQSGNLFSGAPAATEKPQEEKKPSDSAPKSPFQFTPSASTGPSLFSKSETAPAPAASGGSFGQNPSLGASQPPSTGNIFAPKPPASTEEKAPVANPFGGIFAPKPASESKPEERKQQPAAQPSFGGGLFSPKPSEPAKPTTSTPSFSASTPAAGTANPPSAFQPSTSLFQPPPAAAPRPASQRLETMQPKGLSVDLNKHLQDDVELLNRVRILNESFKREITKLDPSKDDFDLVILYYMRVRDTIGAPTGGEHAPKRKTRDEDGDQGVPAQKKAKPFGEAASSSAPQMNIAPSSITSTSSNLFGASEIAKPSPSKRKVDDEDGSVSEPPSAKRSQGDSTTASIFAQTFSNSKSAESDKEEPFQSPVSSPFKPSTPESKKVAPVSTTPTTSPAKTLFPTPAASNEPSAPTSLFGQPSSASKPASEAPKTDAAPANPFTLKPTENKSAELAAAPSFSMPKFGGGGGTNFFAQFKTQAESHAEKEKAKRKEEDFDSEEEDEAEWERKDAEKQRKKREELEAQSQRRAKFIPGQGFSFDEDGSTNTQDSKKSDETNGVSFASSATSVFDTKSETEEKPSNIFSHLSATPTEVEENDGDVTEEASDNEDEGPGSKAATVSKDDGSNDSEDGDFGKALKKSKAADKPATATETTSESTPAKPAGGSLFGSVQDKEGEATPKNPFGSLFSTPKPQASSSGTPSLFAPITSTSGSTSIFGASTNATGGSLFGASTVGTGSLFGAGQNGVKNDQTWKKDSPIKFASDSSSTSKPDTSSSEAPKPFSTLFGAPPAPKPTSGDSKPSLGFTFGAPSTQTSSIFSSAANSAAASAASTPGTSDAGAGESGDGEAAEALPQVNLARGGAGEENEEVLMETRARGLKMAKEGWDSQGVGFVKILKNRETSRSRVVLRADPSGKVLLNASLMKAIKYTINGTGVLFAVPQPDGSLEQWAIRTKKEDIGRLGSTMEEAKA